MYRRTIRSTALEKLARLSAQSHAHSVDTPSADFQRLFKRCPNASGAYRGGMRLQELEAVLALCKSAPFIESTDVAAQLLARLSPYLSESYAQILSPSPSLRTFEPSPYEILTYNLTRAVLTLGLRHEQLRARAASALDSFLHGWTSAAGHLSADQFDSDDTEDYAPDGDLARVMTHSLSLLGFLGATAEHAEFWDAYARLEFVQHVREALSEKFLIAFETALSIVRNAHSHQHGLRQWKRYAKHYAATRRPLGAMILHDSFLKVVVASASLLVGTSPDPTSQASVLQHLHTSLSTNTPGLPQKTRWQKVCLGLLWKKRSDWKTTSTTCNELAQRGSNSKPLRSRPRSL
jgi:phosphatidylinositol 4-kinase